MAEATKVSPGDEATAVQQNDLVEDAQRLLLTDQDTVTIATGVLSVVNTVAMVKVAAESGTADQIDTMVASVGSFSTGDIIVLEADTGDTITIADSAATDGFTNPYDETIILTGNSKVAYIYDTNTWVYLFGGQYEPVSIQIKLSGGGGAIADGTYIDIRWRYDFELKATSIMADQSGTIRVEHWHDTWANFPPTSADEKGAITLSAAQKGEDTALSGYTLTKFQKGEVSRLYVDGAATSIQEITVELLGMRLV